MVAVLNFLRRTRQYHMVVFGVARSLRTADRRIRYRQAGADGIEMTRLVHALYSLSRYSFLAIIAFGVGAADRAFGQEKPAEPAVKARLNSLGDSVAPMTSADFGRLMKSDVEKWAGVIQSANIKLEQ